ncbi:acyl carrier protein, partial [Amycolatopsis anabasis]|uniref:acyl carrier protein n=1 Tax=Amycolatopsis anabasis TaxID=1840409 RepID=UPI00131EA286
MTERVTHILRQATEDVIGLAYDRVTLGTTLSDFGFDSVSLAQFAEVLSKRLGVAVTPDVFFGHPTPARLTAHLVERFGDVLARHLGLDTVDTGDALDAGSGVASPRPVPRRRGRRPLARRRSPARPALGSRSAVSSLSSVSGHGGVSVVGMAGRFPGAGGVSG